MAAETIRDVVIRMSIKQVQTKLEAPNIAPVVEAEKKITEAVKQQSQAQTALRKKSRIEEIAIHEQFYASLRQQMEEETRRGGEMISRQRAEQSRAWAAQREMVEQQGEKVKDLSGAWLGLAEGALKFGRAAALSNKDANEDMTELLGTLVKFQVGFDALSGSQQIIGNIGKAFGASDAAIAGMATGLGTAVAGITAAAVAAYALYQTARDITGLTGAEGLEKAMAEQAGKPGGGRNLSPDEIQRAKRGAVERAVDATAGGLDSAADWVLNNIWDPFGGGSDAKAAKDPNRGELRRFKADQARASIGLQGDIAAGPNRFANRDESRKGLTDEQRLVDLKKEQLELDTKDNDIRLHSIASDATKTEFLEKSAARHRDVQKQIVEALQSQGRTLQDNLAKQQQALATAQAIVDKEKAKADSIAEQVGNLNELEQAELEILAAKIAAGTNTREDTKRAAQLAPGIYGQRDAEEARAAGEDRASRLYRQEKGFGLREGQHAGENERDQIEGQIENLRNELNKKGDEAELAVKELTAAIIADRDRAIKVILDAAKAFRGAAQ